MGKRDHSRRKSSSCPDKRFFLLLKPSEYHQQSKPSRILRRCASDDSNQSEKCMHSLPLIKPSDLSKGFKSTPIHILVSRHPTQWRFMRLLRGQHGSQERVYMGISCASLDDLGRLGAKLNNKALPIAKLACSVQIRATETTYVASRIVEVQSTWLPSLRNQFTWKIRGMYFKPLPIAQVGYKHAHNRTDLKPVSEIISHVVTTEGKHSERISAHFTDLAPRSDFEGKSSTTLPSAAAVCSEPKVAPKYTLDVT